MPRRSPLRTVRATRRGMRLKQATRACGLAYAGFRPGRARSPRRQEAGTRRVAFPHCLEDSLPQSPYLPLTVRPGDPVPIDRCPGRSPAEDPRVRSPYRRLTCPSVPAALANHSSKAHLPMWARFRARAPPGIRPVIRTDQRRADRPRSLSCRLSAAGIGFLGILYPPGLGPSLPPAYRHTASAWRTPTGFPCSARMRHDWGWVPSLPRGRWCPHGRARSLAAICRLPTARPLWSSRRSTPSRDVWLTRHQRGFTGIHPMPSLPLACGPRTERTLLGFSVSFAPDRHWQRRSRTSWRGQVSDIDPGYVFSIG